MKCPHCKREMVSGGYATACTKTGSVSIALPSYCANPSCRADRDAAAIAKAIAAGVIDP